MKFGLLFGNFGEYFDPKLMIELAITAEKSGWDGIFIWDQVLGFIDVDVAMNDPWVVLGAIASKTSKIKIGPMMTPIPRRRPWKLARETITLDHLSNGRLILSVGIGFPLELEYGYFGEDHDPILLQEKLKEGMIILEGLWTGEAFHFNGAHYNLKEMKFLPKPFQIPRIPVWIAIIGKHESRIKQAIKWDGVIPIEKDYTCISLENLKDIKKKVEIFRVKRKDFDYVVIGESDLFIDKKSKIITQYHAAGATWWLESIHEWRFSLKETRKLIQSGPPNLNYD